MDFMQEHNLDGEHAMQNDRECNSRPEGSIPEGSIPEGSIPEGSIPEGSIPNSSIPDGPISDGSISDGSISEDSFKLDKQINTDGIDSYQTNNIHIKKGKDSKKGISEQINPDWNEQEDSDDEWIPGNEKNKQGEKIGSLRNLIEESPEKIDRSKDINQPNRKTPIDIAIEAVKARRKRKVKISESEAMNGARQLVRLMEEAADADDLAIQQNRPATRKLIIANKIAIEMSKPAWRYWFVHEAGLHSISRWIAPLSNGTLPNSTMRRAMLEGIRQLPINEQQLAETSLGKTLVDLWHHNDESQENRDIIRELIQGWIRSIFNRQSDIGDNANRQRELTIPSQPATHPKAQSRSIIPIIAQHEFRIQPQSEIMLGDIPTRNELGKSQGHGSLNIGRRINRRRKL